MGWWAPVSIHREPPNGVWTLATAADIGAIAFESFNLPYVRSLANLQLATFNLQPATGSGKLSVAALPAFAPPKETSMILYNYACHAQLLDAM